MDAFYSARKSGLTAKVISAPWMCFGSDYAPQTTKQSLGRVDQANTDYDLNADDYMAVCFLIRKGASMKFVRRLNLPARYSSNRARHG